MPGDLAGIPWRTDPHTPRILTARRLAEREHPRQALQILDTVLADDPWHVDAHRLRQDLLRRRGRLGLLLAEAEARLGAAPDDPRAHYLRGRIEPGDAEKRQHFRRALELAPDSFWGWLGLAYAWRVDDTGRALAIYDALYRRTRGHPLVALGYAFTLRGAGRVEDALPLYAALREAEELPGVGELGLAECHVALGQREEAWAALVKAVRVRPEDEGVRRLLAVFLAGGLPDAQAGQFLDALAERPDRLGRFVDAGGAALLAALAGRTGAWVLAESALRAGAEVSGATPSVRREARRFRLAMGDVDGYLRALRDDLPADLLDDERNQVRGLWARLWTGPWSGVDDPLGEVAVGRGLVEALAECGLVRAAVTCAGRLAQRHPGDEATRRLLARLRRDAAFFGSVARAVRRAGADPDTTLGETLDEVRDVSQRVFGADVVGTPERFTVPFVGELVDPLGPGLPRYFARYNKHLVLGQRRAAAVEGMVLTRISVRDLDDVGPLPMPGRTREVIGIEREIDAVRGMIGGDLAGVALLNHYVIDLDAVNQWADSLARRRRIVDEDGRAVMSDPVPADAEPLDPVDASWRLAALSPSEDTALRSAVLDIIRWHERAHLVDAFRFLPPERNFWGVLGLLLRNGFDPLAVESEMEGRAETAALAFADDPWIVLAHIAGFLEGKRPGSPHATGFRALARRLCEEMARDPELRAYARVSRWHEAPVERVRALARSLAGRYWPSPR